MTRDIIVYHRQFILITFWAGSFVRLSKIQARDSFRVISEFSLPLSQALSVREEGIKRGCMSADFMLPLLLNAPETDDTRCFFIKRTCPPEPSSNKPHFSYIEMLEGQ